MEPCGLRGQLRIYRVDHFKSDPVVLFDLSMVLFDDVIFQIGQKVC